MSENQPPTHKPKRKPSQRQTKFAAIVASDPNTSPTEAAIIAGYSPKTAHNVGRDILGQPGTISVLEHFRATAHQRLNDELILNKIEAQMDAKKWVNSYTEPDKYVEDWDARDKGIKNALRVRGLDETDKSGGNNMFVNFGDLKSKYKKDE